jgi:choline kinase
VKAVIIAAGMGSRMGHGDPKTLMPFGNSTILHAIMDSIAHAGIKNFIVVVGYEAYKIKNYISSQDDLGAYDIVFAENQEWTRGNGISVMAAEPFVNNEPFILSMSDHIVSPEAIARTAQCSLTENILLVDRNVSGVFDIDDATKVKLNGDVIADIGKNLTHYNGVDCGIFRLTSRYFDSMRIKLAEKKESISAAITGLIEKADMRAVFMEKGEHWSDIDTPPAYNYALTIFKKTAWPDSI